VDGTDLRQLTQDSTNSQPVVSPDGRVIAFVSTRTRNYDIWLMASDGSQQRPFTTTPQWNERHPRFLGDGSLAYLVERREGGRTVTQVIRSDIGTGATTSLSGSDLQITDFAVSPAGDLLALVVPAAGGERNRSPRYRVVVVPAGGAGKPVELPMGVLDQIVTPAFVP
jgi:Tol biopolymer transport system component